MTKLMAALVALAVVGVSVGVFVFYLSSGIVKVAEVFMKTLVDGKYGVSYMLLAEDFKAGWDQGAFERAVKAGPLARVEKGTWGSRSVSGGRGRLEGTILTQEGKSVPTRMSFVKEGDQWKIFSITHPQAGFVDYQGHGEIPREDRLMKIVDANMISFAESVKAKDFTGFYDEIANLWKRETTVEELTKAFKSFTDLEIDLVSALKQYSPQFDKPAELTEDGALVVEGHYPTIPSRFTFDLTYVFEGFGWKLMKMGVRLKPKGS